MAVGRPTKKRDSLVRAICLRLMLGESLNSICKLPHYPSKSTVFKWLLEDDCFSDKYRRAREMQQESFLDEIIEIADDSDNDYIESEKGTQFNSEHVNRSKLRINTRQWVMERMAPRKYGTKHVESNVKVDLSDDFESLLNDASE